MSIDSQASKSTCPFPVYKEDFYADDFILHQFDHFQAMRDLGPVIWMAKHGNFAITRHAELSQALLNWEVFSSAEGIAADDFGCSFREGSIMNDPPIHTKLRKITAAPLRPSEIVSDRPAILKEATSLIENLLVRGSFDGVVDFARHLPLAMVTEFVGLPEGAQQRMLEFALAGFDIMGLQNERGQAGLKLFSELVPLMQKNIDPSKLKPGSYAAKLFDRVAAGEISIETAEKLLPDYLGPSLDTTISVTAQLIYHLGKNPDQWEKLKADPGLIPNAVLEGVRLASPIRSFTRTVTRDFEIGGVTLPKGARVMMLYSAANRDERMFSEPDKLDVTRDTSKQLGFGMGIHICVGQHLAQMEIKALLQAMVSRVDKITVGEPTLALNNTIYGFASLPVTFTKQKASVIKRPAVIDDGWIDVNVVERVEEAEGIISLNFESSDGGLLPDYSAGSHVDLKTSDGIIRQYSLCSKPKEHRNEYRLGVLFDQNSRGGSAWIHAHLLEGTHFQISGPRNLFPLDPKSLNSLLLAGGIGITPILAMAYELKSKGRDFHLHYTVRELSKAAFVDEMRKEFGEEFSLYVDDEKGAPKFDLSNILSSSSPEQHIYCCGPEGLMTAVETQALDAGWPAENLHFERFEAGEVDTSGSFKVLAKRSGLEVDVPEGTTILQAVLDAGIEVAYSCEVGICGTCTCDVLEGIPLHKDSFQSDKEKASNSKVTICCSRSKSDYLILDI